MFTEALVGEFVSATFSVFQASKTMSQVSPYVLRPPKKHFVILRVTTSSQESKITLAPN